MSQSAVISIRQLTNRLENATSSERLNSLQELQIIARSEPKLVGEYSLQSVLDFLKEQGSPEEYQECLDLIDRLIKTRDKSAAIANTGIVLSAAGNVELLLGKVLVSSDHFLNHVISFAFLFLHLLQSFEVVNICNILGYIRSSGAW